MHRTPCKHMIAPGVPCALGDGHIREHSAGSSMIGNAELSALREVERAARDYIDYLNSGKLAPYGGNYRRAAIAAALARLDEVRKGGG